MQIILYAIPVFIALILIEWVYRLLRGRNNYRIADTIASISLGSISRFRGLLGIGLAGLAYDVSYYWFHRISHEANLFWAAHVVHHQSEDYNLGTALRQSGSGEPCIYGIRKPLHSYNPLWAARMCTGARCRMPGARNGGWTSEESGSKVRAGVLRTWKRVTRPRKPSCSISLNMRSMSRLPNGIMPFSSLSAP